MTNYTALTAKWAALPTATTGAEVSANLATIAALTVAGPTVDVSVSSVVGYLLVAQKAVALSEYAATPPTGAVAAAVAAARELVMAMTATHAPPTLTTSQPATLAAIEAMLSALASDPLSGITTTDQAALVSLAQTTIPWWTASVAQGGAGLTSAPNVHDLIGAGLITEVFAQAQGIH